MVHLFNKNRSFSKLLFLDFGFWGFWGVWILDFGTLGILDFGFWGFRDFGFWILGFWGGPGDVPLGNFVTVPGGQRLESALVCLWGPLHNQLYLIQLGQESKLNIFSEVRTLQNTIQNPQNRQNPKSRGWNLLWSALGATAKPTISDRVGSNPLWSAFGGHFQTNCIW